MNKEINYEEILMEEANSIFNDFSFLNLSELDMFNIIEECIKGLENDNSVYMINTLKISLYKRLCDIAFEKGLGYYVLNNYVNNNIPRTLSDRAINSFLDDFDNFIKNNLNVKCNVDDFVKLFSINKNYFNLIEKSYEKFSNGSLEYSGANDVFVCSIDAYSKVNGLGNNFDEKVNDGLQASLNGVNDLHFSLDNTEDFFNEIAKYPVLTQEQEKELSRRIKMGDEEAKNLFILSNIRLVVYVAKKYANSSSSLLDLVQEGIFGLITAVERFDGELGYKFSTYAIWWIRQSINRARVANERLIHVPVRTFEFITKYKTVVGRLSLELGRTPTDEEVMEEMHISSYILKNIKLNMDNVISYNTNLSEETDEELLSMIADDNVNLENNYIKEDAARNLRQMMVESGLTEREQFVLLNRYGFTDGNEHTLEEVGRQLGVTRERVRQIQNKAQRKFKRVLIRKGY